MRSYVARVVATLLGLAAIFWITTALWHPGVDGPLTNAIDFRAFYCGGAAQAAGADPYRVEPVRTCERAALALGGFSFSEKDVLETPYPPLAIAALSLLARLPYRIAVEAWLTLGIAALCAAIVLLHRLTKSPLGFVALALVGSTGFASFLLGQPMPIVVAAFLVAAFAARAQNGPVLALALVVASLQPHLALPAWVAAVMFVPRARLAISIALVVLGLVSLAWLPTTVEYVTTVLPLHARAEVENFTDQYGLAALLREAGVPAAAALRAGMLSYIAMAASGLAIAAGLVRRFDDRAFAVLAPVAAVTLGGTFIHAHQIAVALPCALLLVTYLRPVAKRAVVVTLLATIGLLAIPWSAIADEPAVDGALPHAPHIAAAPFRVPAANELIARSYAEREDARVHSGARLALVQFAIKLPTWCALAMLLFIAAGATARGRTHPLRAVSRA